ncbi:MAG: ImuA family protein [Hyphomicrobiales bacterium]
MRKVDHITGLRQRMEKLERGLSGMPSARLSFGLGAIDDVVEGGLAAGRMHEVNGLAAWSLTLVLAGRSGGPVLWCARTPGKAGSSDHRLYPPGCVAFGFQPSQLVQVFCANRQELLWACEEALRSAALSLVVMEDTGNDGSAISLTAARRLQLAAEAGRTPGLVVSMEPEKAVFPAATTRWQASPAPSDGSHLRMALQLTRNRAGRGGQWMVEWNETARHLSVVSSPCRRPGNAANAQLAG